MCSILLSFLSFLLCELPLQSDIHLIHSSCFYVFSISFTLNITLFSFSFTFYSKRFWFLSIKIFSPYLFFILYLPSLSLLALISPHPMHIFYTTVSHSPPSHFYLSQKESKIRGATATAYIHTFIHRVEKTCIKNECCKWGRRMNAGNKRRRLNHSRYFRQHKTIIFFSIYGFLRFLEIWDQEFCEGDTTNTFTFKWFSHTHF